MSISGYLKMPHAHIFCSVSKKKLCDPWGMHESRMMTGISKINRKRSELYLLLMGFLDDNKTLLLIILQHKNLIDKEVTYSGFSTCVNFKCLLNMSSFNDLLHVIPKYDHILGKTRSTMQIQWAVKLSLISTKRWLRFLQKSLRHIGSDL